MGKYSKERFVAATLRRELVKELDGIKSEGESRSDVLKRLLDNWSKRADAAAYQRSLKLGLQEMGASEVVIKKLMERVFGDLRL